MKNCGNPKTYWLHLECINSILKEMKIGFTENIGINILLIL